MARTTLIQNSFNAGELSPLMAARGDQARYASGCRVLRNMLLHPHGPAFRRPGLRFMGPCADETAPPRLVPFVFNEEQAYVLEFAPERLRVWWRGGLVLGGDGAPLTVPTPYAAEHLPTLRWCQSADVLYLVTPHAAPRKLERHGHADWRLVTVDFGPRVATPTGLRSTGAPSGTRLHRYVITAVSVDTGEESLPTAELGVTAGTPAEGSAVNLAWNAVEGASEYRVYKAGGGASVYGLLGTAATGETYADTGRTPDFAEGPPEHRNPFEGADDYPSSVQFWQQRLCFAGSRSHPQTIWASRTGCYENMDVSRPLQTDDAVTVTIASETVSAVRWMMPARKLLVGTGGGEWTLSGQGSEPFSPLSCLLEFQSARGSADLPPLAVGDGVLAVQRGGRAVRDFRYSLDVDGYSGADQTILAEHMLRGRNIVDWAYQQSPHSVVWCAMDDGTMAGLTLIAEHQVAGWHRHDTGGAVEALCVVPGPPSDPAGGDELWLVVRRDVNGAQRRYIERLDPAFESDTPATAFFVDSGLSYQGPPVAALGGLDHLEGREVSILADGWVHPPRNVAGGRIEVDRPASVIHAGLGYASDLAPVTQEFVAGDGPTQGRVRRVGRARVRLYRSSGFKAGPDADHLREVLFRTAQDPPGQALPLFDGDREVTLDARLGTQGGLHVRQDDPLPLTVLAVISEVEVGEA